MKKILILFGAAAYLAACGDNNVGNRVYEKHTPVDSPNYSSSSPHDDTTATTNNSAYNPDSMPPNATRLEKGSATGQTTGGQQEQARINAGASLPENNAPKRDTGGRKQQ